MNVKTGIISIFLIILSFYCLFADSTVNINGNAEAYIKGEFNRGNHNYGEVSLISSIELNSQFNFRFGAAYGRSSHNSDINAFLKAGYNPFLSKYLWPLGFSVSYIYNGLVDYEVHTHSLLPVISYDNGRYGISLGMNFRFSSFFEESAQFESILSFYVYYNFINNEYFSLRAGAGNFKDFHARNMGAIWLDINAVIRFSDNLSIISEIELMQSGIDGLSSNFYGMSLKAGVRFSW